MTLAELQTRRDTLLKNIANAHKQLTKGDKSVTFQDIKAMEKALAIIDSEIDKESGTTVAKTIRLYTKEY